MNKTLIVFLGVLFLFGCSSTERTPEEIAAAAKARNQCVKEAPMGSIRRVSRCRSEAQVRAEREAARKLCETEPLSPEAVLLKASNYFASISCCISDTFCSVRG